MSNIETRLAEVLAEHKQHGIWPATDDPNGPWEVECNCDIPPIRVDGFLAAELAHAAHQAAMLAPLIAEAQAVVLEEAADALGKIGGGAVPAWWLTRRAKKIRAG